MRVLLDHVNSAIIKPLAEFLASPPPRVAVLELAGAIGASGRLKTLGISASGMESAIEKAFAMPGIKAVALAVNSPGGSPVQSALIYRRIRGLAEEKKLPVYAFAEDVAASGGYWLACAGDKIYAQEASIIGSIGVVSAGFGLEAFIARHGIARRMHAQGESKAMLDPFLPEKEEDVKRLKAIQADIHESFKALVRERRGAALKSGGGELFGGAVWSGREALELGLIDGIGDMRGILRREFGDRVKLKKISPGRGWLSRFLGVKTGGHAPEDWIDAVLSRIESRALWARFGL